MGFVRWGLLSTASINRRVIPAIRTSKRGRLVAVASRNQEKANDYASNWNIPYPFSSYEAMLDSDLVDAVYISLPNHLHAEWSIRAMNSGKHVLCEKPIALTVADVDNMIETSKATGRVLAEALMYRHHPQTKLVGEMVKNGRLGDIVLIRGAFNFIIHEQQNIRLNPEYGGGSLWDVGIYPISFAQYVLGVPPVSVCGVQWVGDTGVDEIFTGQLVYPYSSNRPSTSKVHIAHIMTSLRSPIYTIVEILGTKGRLIIRQPFTRMEKCRKMDFFSESGKGIKITVPKQELYLGEIEDMQAAILDGKSTHFTLEESRNCVRTIVALYQSAQAQRIITL
jgi:predicted dehydrogenase